MLLSFGKSIFKEPEEFLALQLGLQQDTQSALLHLKKVLDRSPTAPLAVEYTYLFLKCSSNAELCLHLIRFISQLADLTDGVSMNSSLRGTLEESQFLTELRHSLTHKSCLDGMPIKLASYIILKELKEKYWSQISRQYSQLYAIDKSKVSEYHLEIYGQLPKGYSQGPKIDISWLTQCGNYQFKQFVSSWLLKGENPISLYEKLGAFKRQILVAKMLSEVLRGKGNLLKAQQILSVADQTTVNSRLVSKFLRQLYFLRYMGSIGKFVRTWPEHIIYAADEYWTEVEERKGPLYKVTQ